MTPKAQYGAILIDTASAWSRILGTHDKGDVFHAFAEIHIVEKGLGDSSEHFTTQYVDMVPFHPDCPIRKPSALFIVRRFLTVAVPAAVPHLGEQVFGNLADPAVHTIQRRRNGALPGLPRFGCAVVEKILLKGGQGVGRAFFLDEARFRQTYEILPVRPRR